MTQRSNGVSTDTNIPQINENVKSSISTTNNMQNINIDTIKQKGKHNNIDTDIIENLDSKLNNTVMALDSRTIKNTKE